MSKVTTEKVNKWRAADGLRQDAAVLQQAVKKAKDDAAKAVDALRDSLEMLEAAHITARVDAERTLSVGSPERLRLEVVAYAQTDERMRLMVQVPTELREAKWQREWGQLVERHSNAEASIIRAGMLMAAGGETEAVSS